MLDQEYELYCKEKFGERVFKSSVRGKEEQKDRKKIGYRENKKIAKEIRGKNIELISYPLIDVKEEKEKDNK